MPVGTTDHQRRLGKDKARDSTKDTQAAPVKTDERRLASTSATVSTHGKDAKLTQRVLEATQRQPDSSKVLEPKSIGRKAVFRPILSSPFVVDWPNVNAADLTAVSHTLLSFLKLDPLQKQFTRINSYSPRSSAAKTKEKNQRRRARLLLATLHRHGIRPVLTFSGSEKERRQPLSPPETKRNEQSVVLCGLNCITRLLEAHIARQAHPSDDGEGKEQDHEETLHVPSIIAVCQADISPPTLVSHLPLLVATYNAMCRRSATLIRLPSGSEALLSDAVQLRRCSVVSVDFAALLQWDDAFVSAGLKELQQKLVDAHVQPIRMPWLDNVVRTVTAQRNLPGPAPTDLLPPRIKHLRSSAPVDMNALKAAKRAKRLRSRQKHKDRVRRLPSSKSKEA